jgi:hypothetical protein
MFSQARNLHDAIYSWKDHSPEARNNPGFGRPRRIIAGASLLDVASDTRAHIPHLRYRIAGARLTTAYDQLGPIGRGLYSEESGLMLRRLTNPIWRKMRP